jgi:hypothetical protein
MPKIGVEWESAGTKFYSGVYEYEDLREAGKQDFKGVGLPSIAEIMDGRHFSCRLGIVDIGGLDSFLERKEWERYPDSEEVPLRTIIGLRIDDDEEEPEGGAEGGTEGVEVGVTYTYYQVVSVINKAADLVADELGLPDTGARDAVNLVVNAFGSLLRNPAVASLDQVIRDHYETDPEEVRSWTGH